MPSSARRTRSRSGRTRRPCSCPHAGEAREAPRAGEIFRQADLAATLRKLVDAERQALAAGKSRKEAIYAAYDRFYKGDIAQEFVRGSRELGGLHTMEDLARWKVRVEEPVMTDYKGVQVYKLNAWTQGPALLQALNILETVDVKAMGYNSARYIHALYQAMNLAFADRDFYYGDTYFPPEEPVKGLLSKEYARARAKQIDWAKNDPASSPAIPTRFRAARTRSPICCRNGARPQPSSGQQNQAGNRSFDEGFTAGTTSIQAADKEGWVVSVTPSGGWIPAAIAGRTGIGHEPAHAELRARPRRGPVQRARAGQAPARDADAEPGAQGRPAVPELRRPGRRRQDQNLLQFFLNVVEFGMTVQQAVEAANINSYQMRSSFDDHARSPAASRSTRPCRRGCARSCSGWAIASTSSG